MVSGKPRIRGERKQHSAGAAPAHNPSPKRQVEKVDATRMTGVREAAGLLRALVDGKGEEDGTGDSMHSTSGVFHNNEIRCATCGIGAHLSGG